MANHTPGPWFSTWITNINKDEYFHISSPVAKGTGGICDLPTYQYGNLPPSLVIKEREANARLIASAPELLEVLKNLIADWERVQGRAIPDDHEAKSAIAKAEGRE